MDLVWVKDRYETMKEKRSALRKKLEDKEAVEQQFLASVSARFHDLRSAKLNSS